jgi:hypothetical protein
VPRAIKIVIQGQLAPIAVKPPIRNAIEKPTIYKNRIPTTKRILFFIS